MEQVELRSKWLLTQNSELKKDGIFAWTLPAFVVQLPTGRHFNTCPNAGICASMCYARAGKFNFPGVKQAHTAKLMMVLEDLPGWEARMMEELQHPRYRHAYIRIHDGGDFFSVEYLQAWLRIARANRSKIFYCYTKEIAMFKEHVEPDPPANFKWVYSMGGKQDHLIDKDKDRHAEVFTSLAKMHAAGYTDQTDSDLMAITNENHRVGVLHNNIPQFIRKQAGRTFGDIQQETNDRLARRHKQLTDLVDQ